MNPCACGWWWSGVRECRCSDGDVARYQARISGPLLDRIDRKRPANHVLTMFSRLSGEGWVQAATAI